MADLGASAVLEWGGSGAPATLFGWDRLVGAGGPEVVVLHSPRALRVVCVALHSSRKVPMACLVGCFVRQIEQFESRPLYSLLVLARVGLGKKRKGRKGLKSQYYVVKVAPWAYCRSVFGRWRPRAAYAARWRGVCLVWWWWAWRLASGTH